MRMTITNTLIYNEHPSRDVSELLHGRLCYYEQTESVIRPIRKIRVGQGRWSGSQSEIICRASLVHARADRKFLAIVQAQADEG